MQRITEDIKTKQFRNVYLLYGAEDYLRKQFRDKLKNALLGDGDSMNCTYLEGKEVQVQKVVDLAETLPFFSERRVIIIENSGLFKVTEDVLSLYLKEMCPSTFFVFSEAEIDKRNKLYKTVKDVGCVSEFAVQDEATLTRWVLGTIRKENKQISEQTMRIFLERTGTSMEIIQKELEKLLCYTLHKDVILTEDVEKICTTQLVNRIFDMVRDVSDKNQRDALNLYYDLVALKEPPMRILFLLSRQFNLLLQIKELKLKSFDNKAIAEKVGLAPFLIGKYLLQASKFSMQNLKQALRDCVEAEEHIKTGKMSDRYSLELLIVSLSSM